jgi:protein-disulfide isomerase
VESNRHNEAIQTDVNLGTSRGVGSTPSFFLNDQILVGAHPLETFNQAITALLNGETIASAQPQPQNQEIVLPTPVAIPVEADKVAFSMGDPNAPVQIVEYTDYQCPFCQQHAVETMPRMITEMVENGRVHYVLKDLPLDQIHPNARPAAKAARCAGEQEAHQEMHDALFAEQARWVNATGDEVGAVFADMAGDLGLDPETFTACFESDRLDAAIQANVDEALAFGVNSTPSFFINGYLLSGAQPYEVFEQVVAWGENGELETQIEASIRASLAAQQAQQQQQQQPPQPTGPVDVPVGDAFAIGSPDAPITIVEYTDFQCPFCSRHFTETYPKIKEAYVDTGIVRYVFKDFPLTSIHPQAFLAAEAARCAGEQDAFLEMHDMLFAKQGEWNGRNDAATIFTGYAEEMGLDPTVFGECLESHRFQAAVQSDLDEGLALGIRGTPTFFINGYLVSGAQPIEAFDQAVQQLQEQQ